MIQLAFLSFFFIIGGTLALVLIALVDALGWSGAAAAVILLAVSYWGFWRLGRDDAF